jgi:hypothetical protein
MVMRSGRNVDHSPPSSVEVKSKCSHTPAPTMRLHDVDREFLTYFTSVTKTLKYFLPLVGAEFEYYGKCFED